MKLEFIQTKNIYEYYDILLPLGEEFTSIFHSTMLKWCNVMPTDKDNFCHLFGYDGNQNSNKLDDYVWVFVNEIRSSVGGRYIFYNQIESYYCMFSAENLEFVICEVID
jgi:hypothetical protein